VKERKERTVSDLIKRSQAEKELSGRNNGNSAVRSKGQRDARGRGGDS